MVNPVVGADTNHGSEYTVVRVCTNHYVHQNA